ncbi:MAG TPA: hypothetical protein VFV99_28080 [Kofleriaceae bacterium]|nr:hypothetical protein [Kofleriaceae bacterium]
MHLVEPEEVGPIEGDDQVVTPPRPPHRRVSVSLLFTLSVLIGLVVTIYLVLPARHNVLVTEAIERHREPGAWDLEAPTMPELRAWTIGVVGKDVPLPADVTAVIGARRVEVLNRDGALMRLKLGSDEISYIVQKGRGIAPQHNEKHDDLHATAWRCGKYNCVAVGPQASSSTWLAAFKKK